MQVTIYIGLTGNWVITGWPNTADENQKMKIALRELEDSDDLRYTEHAQGFYSAAAIWEQTEGLSRFDYVTLEDVKPLCAVNVDSLLASLKENGWLST